MSDSVDPSKSGVDPSTLEADPIDPVAQATALARHDAEAKIRAEGVALKEKLESMGISPPGAGRVRVKPTKVDTVVANVPKAFKLMDDDGRTHEYGPGQVVMTKEHAEHWYAKANGVTIVPK